MLLYLIYRQNAFFPTCRKFRQVDSWLISKFTAVVRDFRTTKSLLQCQLRFILNTIFFIFSFCMKFRLLCTDFTCICQYPITVKFQETIQTLCPVLHVHRNLPFSRQFRIIKVQGYTPFHVGHFFVAQIILCNRHICLDIFSHPEQILK